MWLYAAFNVAAWLFVYFRMPDLTGASLEDKYLYEHGRDLALRRAWMSWIPAVPARQQQQSHWALPSWPLAARAGGRCESTGPGPGAHRG